LWGDGWGDRHAHAEDAWIVLRWSLWGEIVSGMASLFFFDPTWLPSLDGYGISTLLNRVLHASGDSLYESAMPVRRNTIELCEDMPMVRFFLTDLQLYDPEALSEWVLRKGRPSWPTLEQDLWIQVFAKKTGARKVKSYPSKVWQVAAYSRLPMGKEKSAERLFEEARKELGRPDVSNRDELTFALLASCSATSWELQYPLSDVQADSRAGQHVLGKVWNIFERLRFPAYVESECRHIVERFQEPIQLAMSEVFFPWLFHKASASSASGALEGPARGAAVAAVGAAIGAVTMHALKSRG